jgi:hypothetical protein
MRFAIRERTATLALCSLVVACYGPKAPPIDPVPPDWYPAPGQVVERLPDDSVGAAESPCGKACANVYRLGCAEARPSGTSCYAACVKMATLERIPVGCWARANSVPELRACGRVRCMP